ncbi:MAG: hypothetical protein K9I68_05595 [Bacteroidales bacterium]|nr:hypothetical protein [Bacteroidales bacterium]MCF8337884.1 hypothetical protein [Bacteroidales bacterium]
MKKHSRHFETIYSINQKFNSDSKALLILGAAFIGTLILVFLGKGVYGGADNAAHFKLARYAFDNPRFFFDYWAKPGYTILAAPAAQLGFDAVRVLNVFLGVVAAYFMYLIGKRLDYKNAYLIPLLICLAPGYITSMMSANTETSFIFITAVSFYFIVNKNYKTGIILLSFSPLFRPEAIFFLGVVGLIVLIRKKFKLIPYFLTGAVVFFILASIFFNGFEWIKDFFPYGPPEEYGGGTGDFLHYARKSNMIFGIPHALLLALGVLVAIGKLFLNKTRENASLLINKYLLIIFSLIGFYLIQSIAIWKGLGTSYGPFRHMVPVIPLSALIALDGFNIIHHYASKIRYLGGVLIIVLAYFIIRTPFVVADLPTDLKPEQEAVYKASQWLKNSEYYHNKIYFYNSFFTVYNKDLNPYDPNRATFSWGIKNTKNVPVKSIIMWDPRTAPGRGDPLEEFKDNPNFKLLKIIRPKYKFEKNGYPYGIYIFIKQQG